MNAALTGVLHIRQIMAASSKGLAYPSGHEHGYECADVHRASPMVLLARTASVVHSHSGTLETLWVRDTRASGTRADTPMQGAGLKSVEMVCPDFEVMGGGTCQSKTCSVPYPRIIERQDHT